MRVKMLDPEITLFGRRIQLEGEDEIEKEVTEEESRENDKQDDSSAEVMESTNAPAMSGTTTQSEKPVYSEKDSESQEDEKESKDSDPKVLKKPDKILPCPRCNSMDTKFCYHNNYNVNQPRHFCKSCQRYWTAGGTMRNVPIGAGRRKNKSSSSRYCQITVSEALQAARFDGAIGVHHPGSKTNGTVLTLGSESPFCEPVTSVISIADKTVLNGSTRNAFNNRDDGSSVSTVTNSSIPDPVKKCAQEAKQHINRFTNPIPGGFQWPYMWNPAVPVPSAFCPAVFPVPIFPHPNWNGAPIPMNIPWVVPHSPSIQKSPESNPNSPTLGKHTRDEEMATLRTILMPKTLRIDNPDEAAKSSIWSTLGIKKDNKGDSISKGFFNSFESKKPDRKDGKIEAAPVAFTKTNPVALCRSFDFQERA